MSSQEATVKWHSLSKEKRMQGLWELSRGYRRRYFLAILFGGFAALANTGIYALIGRFIDDVLINSLSTRTPFYVLGVVGLALAQLLFAATSGRWAAYVSEKIVRQLRNYLYDHLQHLTFSYHDRTASGELLQRVTSDVDTLRRLYAEQGVGIGRLVLRFLANFGAILLINVWLGLSAMIVLPFIVAISIWFFRSLGKRYGEFQQDEAALTNRLQENLAGVRVVRAFARQEFERERFAIANTKLRESGKKLTGAHSFFWPSTDFVCGSQILLVYLVGAQMLQQGVITTGEFIAVAGLIGQAIWPIREMGRMIADISEGLVSYGRVASILVVEREKLEAGDYRPTTRLRGEITFENLSFTYEGTDKEVLHDISFTVQAGQTVALLGSTGAGKTTLVNLLARFYPYQIGRILLDGIELSRYTPRYLREQVGFVMQEPFLFAETVRDNITYSVHRPIPDQEIEIAARAAAIHESITGFTHGYNTFIGERGVTLSGGQKQRMTLARTILQNPSILVMDDATSAVDTETEAEIRTAMKELAATRTTFLIAHRIQSVMDADLILVLDKGRIVERGTHEQLLQAGGLYRRIYDVQAEIEEALSAELGQGSLLQPQP